MPRAYIFFKGPFWTTYLWRGFSTEENLRFKIDWSSHIVGSKFTVFALLYFYLRAIFQVQAPGGLYLEGRFNGGFGGLIFGGAYTWRGLFSEFYDTTKSKKIETDCSRPRSLACVFCFPNTGHVITLYSKIQLVVYYQCYVLIGWATTG